MVFQMKLDIALTTVNAYEVKTVAYIHVFQAGRKREKGRETVARESEKIKQQVNLSVRELVCMFTEV